jgi:hypothetical protein
MIFRIDRGGISPEGNLRYAIEMTEGTIWPHRGKSRPLPTFAGLKMTTAMAPDGDWRESRWEIPPGTPDLAMQTAESVQKSLVVAFPSIPLGRGAKWKTAYEGTTVDLKTARFQRATFTLLDFDDDQAAVEMTGTITAPAETVMTDEGPVQVERQVSSIHARYVVRFDQLIAEGSRVSRRKWRVNKPGTEGPDAFATSVTEDTFTTIPPPPAK